MQKRPGHRVARVRGRAHAVELVLDHAGEEAVRGRWAMLEAGGVPSLARHTGTTHRPHVTLLSGPAPAADALQAVAEAVGALLPVDLPASGLGLLGRPGRSTLVELVTPPITLLEARARLMQLWPAADSRPWLPHLTLAQRLTPEDVAAALSLLAAPSITGPLPAGPAAIAASSASAASAAEHGVRQAVGVRWWDPDRDRVVMLARS